MAGPRLLILIKVMMDLLFFSLVFSVFFLQVFEYMDEYYIGVMQIQKEVNYKTPTGKSTPMTQIIIASYTEFNDNFCNNPISSVHPVCNNQNNFETAGIIYLVFSSLSILLFSYGFIGMLGMFCKCTCFGLFRFTFIHYIYPIFYTIGLVLYIVISQLFSLSTPSSCNNCKMQPSSGLFLMFLSEVLCIANTLYFFICSKRIKSFIATSQEGYVLSSS